MTRIAHLTDLHFGAEDTAVVEALVAEINADPPDLVAISGDLTQGGHYTEFRAARVFMDRLAAPWLAVPGNHDITPYNLVERFTDPYRRWRRTIGLRTEPDWQNDSVAVLGLNTARRGGLYLDWSRGRFTSRRLHGLERRLDGIADGIIRVVVAHHPLMPPPSAPETRVAGGSAPALAALRRHDVALVLAGHLHRGFARLSSASGEPPLVLQGGTATSVRLRGEPNSYNRVTISAAGEITVEPRTWDGRSWTTRPSPLPTPRRWG